MDFEVDKDFALLYGIMLGDGCLSSFKKDFGTRKGVAITIAGSSDDDLPFFQKVINPKSIL